VVRHARFSGRTQTLPRVKTRLSVTTKGDKAMPTSNNGCRRGVAARTPSLRVFFSPPAKVRPAARRGNTTIIILAMMQQHLDAAF
jgi:hypothetical protein